MDSLDKFIVPQRINYDRALKEIEDGKKLTHWSWYIFPQLKGLGFSAVADYYGIKDLQEAKLYLTHEYLKNNLIQISQALLNLKTNNPIEVLGYPDNLKLKSCMTLFYYADPSIDVFKKVIDKFYNGEFDDKTTLLLLKEIKK